MVIPAFMDSSNVTATDKQHLFEMVFGLRLLDNCALMEEMNIDIAIPIHVKAESLSSSCGPYCKNMADWTRVISAAREASSNRNRVAQQGSSSGSTLHTIMRSIIKSRAMSGRAKIEWNFNMAALHLLHLTQSGSSAYEMPGMPSNSDLYVQTMYVL